MAKKIRVWDGSAWQDVAPALPYTAVHSAQASMPSTAVDGQIWLDTDASVPSTTVTRWYKLPSAGTTTLSGNDDNSIPLAYTPGYEQVFLNGTLLSRSAADYTATTGTSVVLSSAIVAGDIVEIICPLQITTTDTYTQAATNAAFQANTNNFAAGKNKIINGDFRINQRAFTTATAGGVYLYDRFYTNTAGASSPIYTANVLSAGEIPGYDGINYLTMSGSASDPAGVYMQMDHRIEDVRTLAGETVTLSFWAKGSSSGTISANFTQDFGTSGSAREVVTAKTIDVSTSWNRYFLTFLLPSISGKTIGAGSSLRLILSKLQGTSYLAIWGSATFSGVLSICGIQLESGSNMTAFQTATGTIQGELAACQRYYWRKSAANNLNSFFATGSAASTTSAFVLLQAPTTMRVPPTAIDFSGCALNDGANSTNVTSLTLNQANENGCWINAVVSSGLTQFRPYVLWTGTNVNAFIGLSSEL